METVDAEAYCKLVIESDGVSRGFRSKGLPSDGESGMILAGDVGGTKCNLGLFLRNGPALRPVFQRRLPTRHYAGLEDVVSAFLEQAAECKPKAREDVVEAVGFGLAGVVVDGFLHAENLSWVLNEPALARKLHVNEVVLLNDLAATALSIPRLSANDFVVLNPGKEQRNATKAVIAAGTGLGEAILYWDGQQYRVEPSEGGQVDFAPRGEFEMRLLRHWSKHLTHISCEEIVSGRGFRRIHEFLDPGARHDSFDAPEGDAAKEITERALAQSCAVCVETLDHWIEAYGAHAGNLALRTLALGGIYVAGGIAPKILPRLQDGAFLRAFCGKSKFESVLARIPLSVIVNEDAPVWGAAYQALASRKAAA